MKTDNKIRQEIIDYFELTTEQILFAEYFMRRANNNYQAYYWLSEAKDYIPKIKKAFELAEYILTDNDVKYTLDKLENDFYFIKKNDKNTMYTISDKGHGMFLRYNSFLLFLSNEISLITQQHQEVIKERNLKEEIDMLTLKQLKGSIFQIRFWWLFLLINAIISFIIAWLF